MLNTIALLIPVFLLIVFVEGYFSYRKRDHNYTIGNTTMNLAIGAIDQTCSLFYFALLYFVLKYVYEHFRLFEIPDGWSKWVLAYVVVDFLSYWYHRFSHRVNILWAGHVTHHSSEHFNYTNGFRTSVFQGINRIAFWSVLPVFGFSPLLLVITLKVSGIYDFIVHTSYVPRIGFLEKILITPSLHRVHHGKNDIYIDKNYGSTFVIWDKMFGTFQEETETVQYGIKSPYIDNNPFKAIGHYYHYLWTTMLAAPRWSDKVKIFLMPPEWKPELVRKSETLLPNLHSHIPHYLKSYAWFQIVCCAGGLITMLVYKDFLSYWEIMLFSVVGVTAMANSAMIFNENVGEHFPQWELVRLALALILIGTTWMLHHKLHLVMIGFYLMVSLLVMVAKLYSSHEKQAVTKGG